MTVCRSCGARVEWAQTAKGLPMPLDLGPTPDGNLVLVAGVTRMRTEADQELEPRRSHFATCKQAAKWRRPR